MASIINSTTTAGVTVTGDNSGSLQLATNNGTTAVTIDTSQNVGIGVTSPAQKLDVLGSARLTFSGGSNYIEFQSASNYVGRNGSTADIWLNAINGQKTILGVNNVAVAQCSGTDFQFNSGYGSVATAYGCRAWVNFNGTGTVAIRGSGNVSSITDNGTGQYTINMTTAMPDTNYSATMGAEITFSGATFYGNGLADFANWTTSACKVRFLITGGGNWDPELCCIAIHR